MTLTGTTMVGTQRTNLRSTRIEQRHSLQQRHRRYPQGIRIHRSTAEAHLDSCRKSDMDDVISSFSVYGDVTIAEPPTYTPTNAQETTLTLNPANVLKDLATKLAGAAVEISAGTSYWGTRASPVSSSGRR